LHLIIVVELFPQRDVSLGEETSGHRNVTINSNNLFVNFRWTFTFCFEKSYDETTSHLAGLWIGAAISNTSHSNKAGSTTVKRARLKVKDQGSVATVSTKKSISIYT
jgi:hypothetical protein